MDHLLLSGQQSEGGIKAFIKPSSSFILGNLHTATVNFHLPLWETVHLFSHFQIAYGLQLLLVSTGKKGESWDYQPPTLFIFRKKNNSTELRRIDAYSVLPFHAWLISAEVAESIYLEWALIPAVRVWLQLGPFAASHVHLWFCHTFPQNFPWPNKVNVHKQS